MFKFYTTFISTLSADEARTIEGNRSSEHSNIPLLPGGIPFRCMWLLFRGDCELDMQHEAGLSDTLKYFVGVKEETPVKGCLMYFSIQD